MLHSFLATLCFGGGQAVDNGDNGLPWIFKSWDDMELL